MPQPPIPKKLKLTGSVKTYNMNCSLPGSSVHRISQARILEWVTISFSGGSSQPRDRTCVSCIAGGFFTAEPLGKHHMLARLCSKFFKLGFSSTTQMYNLGLEKTEGPEIKLLTLVVSWRKQGNIRKTATSASLTTLKPLTMWTTTNCGKFLKKLVYQTTLPVS